MVWVSLSAIYENNIPFVTTLNILFILFSPLPTLFILFYFACLYRIVSYHISSIFFVQYYQYKGIWFNPSVMLVIFLITPSFVPQNKFTLHSLRVIISPQKREDKKIKKTSPHEKYFSILIIIIIIIIKFILQFF